MSVSFDLNATKRADQGKGASRRLRHADQVPAVIYGGDKPAASISLSHNKVILALEHEAFYSHLLTLDVDGVKETVILKAVQRHPYKPKVQHLDFLRVSESEKLHTKVPLHFVNEAGCPAVKAGAQVHHDLTEVEIVCLPKYLPEFIEVDLKDAQVNQIIHLADLKLPAGVALVALQHGDNKSVVSIHRRGGAAEEAAPSA